MLIEKLPVHDLKTDRPDIMPPLPGALKIVPIVFYLSLIGGIALTALLLFQLADAKAQLTVYTAMVNQANAELAVVRKQRASVEAEAKRAQDVASWIEGTREVQPLIVAINRSIEGRNSLSQLKLARNEANPAQILLNLKLNTESGRQLDRTLDEIFSQQYRSYSAQQSAGDDGLDYRATLIFQEALPNDDAAPADGEKPDQPRRGGTL